MVRSVAWLMRVSKGSFSHTEVMALTWRQFETYLDAFKFCIREESKEGRAENKIDDLTTLAADPTFKQEKQDELDTIRSKLKRHKERAKSGKRKEEEKLV